jgi:autoinducer 2-degrading protein
MKDSMYSILVAINIKPDYRDAFIEASIAEAKGSVKGEPGIFQFQMAVDEANPNRFYFFEIFKNEAAAKDHWETEVFKTWWNTVEEMFDGGTERICTMRTIFPSVSGLEKQKPGLMNW